MPEFFKKHPLFIFITVAVAVVTLVITIYDFAILGLSPRVLAAIILSIFMISLFIMFTKIDNKLDILKKKIDSGFEKKEPLDYNIWDQIERFTIDEASKLLVGQDPIDKELNSNARGWYVALHQAIEDERIPKAPGLHGRYILRKDLKKFLDDKNLKTLLTHPEERK